MYNIELEDRAARIVEAAVKEAAVQLVDYVRSKLARGQDVDARWLATTVNELTRLNDEFATAAVNRIARDFVQVAKASAREAVAQGRKDGMAASLDAIDEGLVRMALVNTKILVKGILDKSVGTVASIVTNAIITRKPLDQVAETIRQRVRVEDGDINVARAVLIARSEIMSIYRQVQVGVGDQLGYQYYIYTGPKDYRTEKICLDALGVVTTLDEWRKVSDVVELYGLHYGCRHTLRPIKLFNPVEYQVTVGGVRIRAWKEGPGAKD